VARQRDYRAEYRARVERAQKLGLSRAQATGHAGRKGQPSIKQLRAEGRYHYQPKRPPGRKPRVVDMAAGRMVNTSSMRFVRDQLRWAAKNGKRVTLVLTADAGNGPRTHNVDGHMKGYAGLDGSDVTLYMPVRMVIGDDYVTGGGLDPQDVLDLIAENDGDVEGTLAELWAGGE
jgi:hypothetical protein